MAVQILIRMDRVDLAAKKRAQMAKVDEDATITLLAGCWVSLASVRRRQRRVSGCVAPS